MNRLERERSPYLRQHAANPVDWHPWGEEAFERARAENKPIFLSIGYATCHWCHVMARESFEDPATAKLLNEHFVSVKVDREERPDVDHVYMSYVQALTGHGGWPLSAWLTPERAPFFGGTYFPPDDRHNRAGFPAILGAIAKAWREEREKLVDEGGRVVAALRAEGAGTAAGSGGSGAGLAAAAAEAFDRGFRHFRESFDPARGGFGGAPKFPRAGALTFLLRCAARAVADPDIRREAAGMAAVTLRQMARGGIHDHVGGGFHRYSVDEDWQVPHFEKMLYDQAQIAVNALEAWQATGDERHAWLARDILEYVQRDLASPQGGFYSAEDADSRPPGRESSAEASAKAESLGVSGTASSTHNLVEGAFYVWTKAEIASALGEDAPLICTHFGVAENGNVSPRRDPHGEFRGKNILAQARSLAETAKALNLSPEEASDRLAICLERLRLARAQRPRPLLDDKILTAWNGLAISALALAAALPAESLAGRRQNYRDAAVRAADFVERELFDAQRGVLFRFWREGRGATEGFAEDYAFLIQGLLDLYEATFDRRRLEWAGRLQEKMDELFWDGERGGYYNSGTADPNIVVRLKEDYDGAAPAPGSVAALNLLRLDALSAATGREGSLGLNYLERALRSLAAFRGRWVEAPHALPQMLAALEPALDPPRHIVLAGDPRAADFQALADVLRERQGPRRPILAADSQGTAVASWLAAMRPIDGRATAYVCENFTCRAPVTTPEELRAILRE
jgi:uncharacterized protein YyaL (SSP411 family)